MDNLDAMPMMSFDFSFKDGVIIKDSKDKHIIEHIKKMDNQEKKVNSVYFDYSFNITTTFGDLYGEFFYELSKELDEKNHEI